MFGCMTQRRPSSLRTAVLVLGLALTASCASLEFERETPTSGTFRASGWAFTLFSIDIPKSAVDVARSNVSDARQPNVVVTEASVWPYLGPLDFIFEIIGVRRARVSGTWGFSSTENGAESTR